MINKYLIIVVSSLLLFIGCNKSKNEQQAISAAIDSFYAAEPIGNYRFANQHFLSTELVALLQKSSIFQRTDSARLKALGSSDKPLMIEGDIFTSLLEGSTSHSIEEISIHQNKCNSTINSYLHALITVKFCNQHYDNYTWKDTVEMIHEKGSWRIHNVRYAKGAGSQPTLQKTLREFLKMEITQFTE